MPFRNHAINGCVRDGLLEREPLHLGFAPRPALTVNHCVGQRNDDGDFLLAVLALAVYTAQELIVLGARPGQDVDD